MNEQTPTQRMLADIQPTNTGWPEEYAGTKTQDNPLSLVDGRAVESVAQAMSLLGAAYRGDWSDFDGRTLRDQLDELIEALRSAQPFDVESWAHHNNICPERRGWHEHCTERSEGVGYFSCDHQEAFLATQHQEAPR